MLGAGAARVPPSSEGIVADSSLCRPFAFPVLAPASVPHPVGEESAVTHPEPRWTRGPTTDAWYSQQAWASNAHCRSLSCWSLRQQLLDSLLTRKHARLYGRGLSGAKAITNWA